MREIIRRVKTETGLLKELQNGKYNNNCTHIICGLSLVPEMTKLCGKDIKIVDTVKVMDINGEFYTRFSGANWTWIEEWLEPLEPLEPPVVKLKLFDEE